MATPKYHLRSKLLTPPPSSPMIRHVIDSPKSPEDVGPVKMPTFKSPALNRGRKVKKTPRKTPQHVGPKLSSSSPMTPLAPANYDPKKIGPKVKNTKYGSFEELEKIANQQEKKKKIETKIAKDVPPQTVRGGRLQKYDKAKLAGVKGKLF